MKIYLDVCCLNRPFDDQGQDRIRLEAEAILLILRRVEAGEWTQLGSEAVDLEIEHTPDQDRQARVRLLAQASSEYVLIGEQETARGQQLAALGFQPLDSLHLACAESGHADVFLSTDDRLLRRAKRVTAQLGVKVRNPLRWLEEAIQS